MAGIDFHGDGRKLEALVTGLRRLTTAETRHELAERIAQHALTLVALGFKESKDPYGRPWKPLRSRSGQPLLDTGRLASSFTAQAAGDDVRLGTNVAYAAVHQYGAVISAKKAKYLAFRVGGARPKKHGRWVKKKSVTIPRRQMVPEGDLGPIWTDDFEKESEAILQEAFPA